MALDHMIQFIYTGDYPDVPSGRLTFHLEVFKTALRYEVEGLDTLVRGKIAADVDIFLSSSNDVTIATWVKLCLGYVDHVTMTNAILKSEVLKALGMLVDKYQPTLGGSDGQSQDAPGALANMQEVFKSLNMPTDKKDITRSWKCSGCSTEFLYNGNPKSRDMKLAACPCCSTSATEECDPVGSGRKRART